MQMDFGQEDIDPLKIHVLSKEYSTIEIKGKEICFVTADDMLKSPKITISEESGGLHVGITFLPQSKGELDKLLKQIDPLPATQEMLLKEQDLEVPYFNAVGC